MKGIWHSLKVVMMVALAALWLHMDAMEMTCHCDHDTDGHLSSATSCLCVCHHVLGILFPSDSRSAPVTEVPTFDYMPPHGTPVPTDIFRPPLH